MLVLCRDSPIRIVFWIDSLTVVSEFSFIVETIGVFPMKACRLLAEMFPLARGTSQLIFILLPSM